MLHNQVANLKIAVNLESKNRATSLKALQKWLENRIEQWTVKIEEPMIAKLSELNDKIDAVVDRVDACERQRDIDVAEYPKLVDARAAELLEALTEHRAAYASSEKHHEEVRKDLLVRLAEQGKKLRQTQEAEKVVREKKIAALAADIVDEHDIRAKSYEVIKKALQTEVASIHVSHEKEVGERQQADEEIVQAVNHYSAALQDAIRLISDHD
jgi:hypothetical protein